MKFTRHLIIVFLSCSFTVILAQSRQELEDRRMKIIKEIEQTSKTLENTKKNKSATLKDLSALEKQIENRRKLISTIKSELVKVDETISYNNTQIDSLVSNISLLKEQYSKLIRSDYLRKTSISRWIYVFSATGINDAFLRWRYTQQFEQYCLEKTNQINSVTKRMSESNEVLQEEAEERKKLLADMETQNETLDKEIKQKDEILKKLEKNEEQLRADLDKHKRDREFLNKEIEKVILAGLKAAKESEKSSAENTSKSTSFEKNKGRIPWPVKSGYVSKSFGTQKHPTLRGISITNNGIDISTSPGSEVYSVFEGKVVGITTVPGYDYMLIVQHGNFYTVYSRLNEVKVRIGSTLKQGELIGRLASDGNEIHFELWKDKTKLNPQEWIDKK